VCLGDAEDNGGKDMELATTSLAMVRAKTCWTTSPSSRDEDIITSDLKPYFGEKDDYVKDDFNSRRGG
jgi:hypothetical protein